MALETEFFAGKRKEVQIGNYQALNSSPRRIRVDLSIPLSNRPLDGTPEWVLIGNDTVVKDRSFFVRCVCDRIKMEGMSVDFYSTDKVKSKLQTLVGCTLDKFTISRDGKDETAQTYLNFFLYTPASRDLAGWFYDLQGATAFATFDSTQAEFSYNGEAVTGDEEEEDEPEAHPLLEMSAQA